jgi:hypothetical protein
MERFWFLAGCVQPNPIERVPTTTSIDPLLAETPSGGLRLWLIEVPTDDPKAVPDRGLERGAIEPPVGSGGNGHEGPDPRVGRDHDPQEPLDVLDVCHELGSRQDVVPA